ncbi:MAG TPA: M28 family metallopeptidase [Acidobacteriota bacterium]|jgi:hypothetical protein|nr:M28 family metallopeptidase [Acidobacteriota bacterium]
MKRYALISIGVVFFILAANAISDGQRWWAHVRFLADDKMEGRNTGSEAYRKAAAYVEREFERAGLKPAGASGYYQPVKFHSRRIIEEQSSLALVRKGTPEPLVLGKDATLSMRIEPAPELEAPLIFAGYGLTVPEMKYDDLAGLDLKGKVVVYLSGGPSSIPGPLRSHYQSAGERWSNLKRAGVVGTITIQNPRSMDIPWERSSLARFQPAMSLTDPGLDETVGQKLSVTINPASADKLFAGSGHSFKEILALADSGKSLPRFPIPASVKTKVRFEHSEVESPNVVAVLPGTDPKLKNEYVVLSAHLDHVGVGQTIKGDKIYNGAMDNASGVASLLDIAETIHESKKSFRRSLLFLALTGEEKGLLGSKYFTAYPTVKREALVADLNIDMFLPIFPLHILTVLGLDESDLGQQARAAAKSFGIEVQTDIQPERNLFIRSDQYNFIRQGIPSLAFKVGFKKGSPQETVSKKWLTERYHAPSDDVNQPVDIDAAGGFDRAILSLAESVANRSERPKWNQNSFFRRFAK